MIRAWLAVALLLLIWSTEAMAAKNATISGQNVVLRGTPSNTSDVLAQIPDGTAVEVSNYPTEGFYKVRTPTGQIGWVDAHSVNVGGAQSGTEEELPPPPDAHETAPSTLSSPTQSTETSVPYVDVKSTETEKSEPSIRVEGPRLPLELKALVGYQKISMTDVNSLIGESPMTSTTYFGGEFGYPLAKKLKLLLRLERLKKSATDAKGVNFQLSSTPVMAGLGYVLADGGGKRNSVSLDASFLFGPALSTTLDATNPALASPNTTELSTTSFSEIFRLSLDIPFGKVVGFDFEAGYRILKTGSVGPSKDVNGSDLFQISGVNAPVPLDLSGPFFGGGLCFMF